MIDISYFAFLYIFFFALGLPFVRLLPASWSWKTFCLSGILGISLTSLLVSILYSHNLSLVFIFYILATCAIISLSYSLFLLRFNLSAFWKSEKFLLFSWVFCVILLILPRLVGGTRFSIFQGNHHDTFMYWEAALNVVRDTYQQILGYQSSDIAEIPLRSIGQRMLDHRPTSYLLFALSTRLFPMNMPQLNYTFLIFLFSQSFLGLCFMIRNLFNADKVRSVGIALAFVLGFYGQYILDINAWSQIAATPLEIGLLAVLILTILNYSGKNLLILALLLISLLYVYPEMYLFNMPALFFILLMARYYKCISNRQIVFIASIIIISLLSGFLYYRATIGFLLSGQDYGNAGLWTYFQKYLFGQGDVGIQLKQAAEEVISSINAKSKRDAVNSINWVIFLKQYLGTSGNIGFIMLLLGNIMAGLMGLYFITPIPGISNGLALAQTLLLSLWCAGILIGTCFVICEQLRLRNKSLLLFIAFMMVMFCQIVTMLPLHLFWESCKSLSYISPFFVTFVCLLTIFKSRHVLLKQFVNVFIVVQICFGIYRVYGSTDHCGIHYSSPPYVSIQTDARNAKIRYNWNFENVIRNAADCNLVRIDVADKWIVRYLYGSLYNQNINVFVNRSVLYSERHDGSGVFNTPPDCTISEKAGNDENVVYLSKLD